MKVGIIGGSGLYEMEGLEDVEHRTIETSFGMPSDDYVCGRIGGNEVAFLPRHGRGHRILPAEINHRANIMGFKMMGVQRVISVSAVGSLKEELRPGDMVLPDQYFDRTKNSMGHTYFGGGAVAHVAFAEPSCADLRGLIEKRAGEVIAGRGPGPGVKVVSGGTYVNMEGPAFSSRAESLVYRQFGFDIIGMTSLAEAKLCREAEMCYQAMSMVTDYDCWRGSEEHVTVERVIEHLTANTELAGQVLLALLPEIPQELSCNCCSSLENAILTERGLIPEDTRRKLDPIIGKYL